MIHTLLVAALVLFALWVIGLAGHWAAGVAWILFVIGCVLVVAWLFGAVFSGVLRRGGGTRPLAP